MNNIPSQTTNEYDNVSGSNPSLITAGLPSGSRMTSHLRQHSSSIIKRAHTNDTQPIITLDSQYNDHSQSTIVSHRSVSDTYLNLSRKDINDVMTALHTLAQCIHNDMNISTPEYIIPTNDNESHPLTMLYSKSTNHTLQSSTPANNSFHHKFFPKYSARHRRRSLSSNCCYHHSHRHHIKNNQGLMDEFQTDLYHIKRKEECRLLHKLQCHQKYFNHYNPSSYPSYSSNAMLYTSRCRSKRRPRQIYHSSLQHQSTKKVPSKNPYKQSIKKNLSSSIPLVPSILDKFISIDEKESISTMQILPQHAHTLQILQKQPLNNIVSMDSFNNKDMFIPPVTPCYLKKYDQTLAMGDQGNLNKIDVATQWSLQILPSKCNSKDLSKFDASLKCHVDQKNSTLDITPRNATILTELSQSVTSLATNDSIAEVPSVLKKRPLLNNTSLINDSCNIKPNIDTNDVNVDEKLLAINNEQQITKSEPERFLKLLNIPTCKCSTKKLDAININEKNSSLDDNITCISLDDDSSMGSCCSSVFSDKKKSRQRSIKIASKRPRLHTSNSSKNSQTIKRSRTYRRSQSNNRSIAIIQSYKTTKSKEDSFFDFFDIDATFSDAYDRLFTDITSPETQKYIL